jgi:hypothetical protein
MANADPVSTLPLSFSNLDSLRTDPVTGAPAPVTLSVLGLAYLAGYQQCRVDIREVEDRMRRPARPVAANA